jgi:hypothetical protein
MREKPIHAGGRRLLGYHRAMPPHDRLLIHGRELLRWMREDRDAWPELAPQLGRDAEGDEEDRSEVERLQLAWALQYEGDDGDDELARYALQQEIAWRRVSPYQGIGETLEILAWLVARERRVDDVWLMVDAKGANFDTSCGFDLQHLVAGGVAATLGHVRGSERPEAERKRVLEALLGEGQECPIDEEEVSEWLELQAKGYPRAPAAEPLTLWIDRAIAVGEKALAVQLIEQWSTSESCERDSSFLAGLAYRFGELGEHDREATVRDELLLTLSSPFERAGERCRVAAAARRARQWACSLEHLDHAALLHRPRAPWRELGLGRELVHEAFELAENAATAGDLQLARRAFALGAEFAEQTPRLAPVTLESRAKAERLLARH